MASNYVGFFKAHTKLQTLHYCLLFFFAFPYYFRLSLPPLSTSFLQFSNKQKFAYAEAKSVSSDSSLLLFFFPSSLALSFSFSFSHTLTLSHTHYRRKTKPKLKAMMLEMAVAEFKACFAQEKSFWREGAAWYTLKGAEFKFCFSVFFILFYFIRFRFKGK